MVNKKSLTSLDIDLMNIKYRHFTNNGSFVYYGVGGICSGSFCIDQINWIEPEVVIFAPTFKPTSYPTNPRRDIHSFDTVDDSPDRTWFIIGLVFINLFVLTAVYCSGIVIYLWSKKEPRNKHMVYDNAPHDVQITPVHTQKN